MKRPSRPYTLITGGAGFIGTNLAARLAGQGRAVLIYDSLSRKGVDMNLNWLLKQFPEEVTFWNADVRDAEKVRTAVMGALEVFHLAAQVAVTNSLMDPVLDFEINARGTLNVLEAVRSQARKPPLLFSSTNKVFGNMDSLPVIEQETRYVPADDEHRLNGINENWRIEFCSPYGCSKGSADQYVLDYSRCYNLRAVVFRMSCIYGPHQYGNEDQGWVAHFVRQAAAAQPITFYGDGKQVRDALYIEDLLDAFMLAIEKIDVLRGRAFNIGGGPKHTTSLIELIELIAKITGKRPQLTKEDWRTSDQRYYVSDVRAFQSEAGWSPKVTIAEGVLALHKWWTQKNIPIPKAVGDTLAKAWM